MNWKGSESRGETGKERSKSGNASQPGCGIVGGGGGLCLSVVSHQQTRTELL